MAISVWSMDACRLGVDEECLRLDGFLPRSKASAWPVPCALTGSERWSVRVRWRWEGEWEVGCVRGVSS